MNYEGSELVARMRASRRSPAALKIALSHIRSAKPTIVVFVFEGVDDVGPYQIWLARCKVKPVYEPLPGKGKDQLLAFRQMLQADTTGIRNGVFFFVDRDFDGLKGAAPGPDIYVHKTYSAENQLVREEVLESLLIDELRCAGLPLVRVCIMEAFQMVFQRFHDLVRSLNFRLFVARKVGIRVINLEESISSFVSITLDDVELVHGASASEFLKLMREPTAEEEQLFSAEFDTFVPARDYRGKFELQMFTKWVSKLSEDRCSPAPRMFDDRVKVANMHAALTMRSLAGRCPLPYGLEEFVASTKTTQVDSVEFA